MPEVQNVPYNYGTELAASQIPLQTPVAPPAAPKDAPLDGEKPKPSYGVDWDAVSKETAKTNTWMSSSDINNPSSRTPYDQAKRYDDPLYGFRPDNPNIETQYGDREGFFTSMGKTLAKTGVNVLGGFVQTLAVIPDAINAISSGDLSKMYDNDINNSVTDMMKAVDDYLPTYKTTWEENHPVLNYIPFKGNGWSKVFENIGFVAGAISGSALLDAGVGALTGGVGEAPLIASQIARISQRLGKIFGSGEKAIEALTKAGAEVKNAEAIINAASPLAKIGSKARYALALQTGAWSQAAMMAGTTHEATLADLKQHFFDTHGYDATGDDLAKVNDYAHKAANSDVLLTAGLLSIVDAIQFPTILKPFNAAKRSLEISLDKGIGATFNKATQTYEENAVKAATGKLASLKKFLPPPRLLLSTSAETAKMGGQVFFQKAAQDFYHRKFDNEAVDSTQNLFDSMSTGLNDVLFTPEGREATLMGGLIGIGIHGIRWGAEKFRGLEHKSVDTKAILSLMNSHTAFGTIGNHYDEAVTQVSIQHDMKRAVETGDVFQFQNLKRDALFESVHSAIQANKFDARMQEWDMMKELSPEEFKQQFKMELTDGNKTTIGDYIESVKRKAHEFKKDIEKVNNSSPNPYKFNEKQKYDYAAYEIVKKEMAKSLSDVRDSRERSIALKTELSDTLKGVKSEDMMDLTSDEGVKDTIKRLEEKAKAIRKDQELLKGGGTKEYVAAVKEAQFLDAKIEGLKEHLDNNTRDLDNQDIAQQVSEQYLPHLQDLVNYYKNGDISGKEPVDRIDLIDGFHKAADLYKLDLAARYARDRFEYLTDGDAIKKKMSDYKTKAVKAADKVVTDEKGNIVDKSKIVVDQYDDNGKKINPAVTTAVTANAPKLTVEEATELAALKTKANPNEEATSPLTAEEATRLQELQTKETAVEQAAATSAEEPAVQELKPIVASDGAVISTGAQAAVAADAESVGADGKKKTTLNVIKKQRAKAPLYDGVNPNYPLRNIFIQKGTSELTDLRHFLFTSPESIVKGLTLKISKFKDGTKGPATPIRADYPKVRRKVNAPLNAEFVVEGKVIGRLQDPDSLFHFKDNKDNPLSEISQEDYVAATGNKIESYDSFIKAIKDYKELYNKLVGDGTEKTVPTEELYKLMDAVPNYGGRKPASIEAADSTLISKLAYRGKGDVILSFPVEYDIKTGDYHRTRSPVAIGEVELLDANEQDPTNDSWYQLQNFLGSDDNEARIVNTIDHLRNMDSRYILVQQMPNGEYSRTGVIVARPVEATKEVLDQVFTTIQGLKEGQTPEEIKKINEDLRNNVYIADVTSEKGHGNVLFFRTDADGSLTFSVINPLAKKGSKSIGGVTLTQGELGYLKSFDDVVTALNSKIKTVPSIKEIALSKESFKTNIPNDTEGIFDKETNTTRALEMRDVEHKLIAATEAFPYTNFSLQVAEPGSHTPPFLVQDPRIRYTKLPALAREISPTKVASAIRQAFYKLYPKDKQFVTDLQMRNLEAAVPPLGKDGRIDSKWLKDKLIDEFKIPGIKDAGVESIIKQVGNVADPNSGLHRRVRRADLTDEQRASLDTIERTVAIPQEVKALAEKKPQAAIKQVAAALDKPVEATSKDVGKGTTMKVTPIKQSTAPDVVPDVKADGEVDKPTVKLKSGTVFVYQPSGTKTEAGHEMKWQFLDKKGRWSNAGRTELAEIAEIQGGEHTEVAPTPGPELPKTTPVEEVAPVVAEEAAPVTLREEIGEEAAKEIEKAAELPIPPVIPAPAHPVSPEGKAFAEKVAEPTKREEVKKVITGLQDEKWAKPIPTDPYSTFMVESHIADIVNAVYDKSYAEEIAAGRMTEEQVKDILKSTDVTVLGDEEAGTKDKSYLSKEHLYEEVQKQLDNLPTKDLTSEVEELKQVAIENTPKAIRELTLVKDKADVKKVMQTIFGLNEKESEAVATIYDLNADAWANRNKSTKEKYYDTLAFQKSTPEDLQGAEVLYQAEVFHGSPHVFDKFTTKKIGTGEGNQSFGYGLYFTDRKGIAESYANKLSKTKDTKYTFERNGVEIQDETLKEYAKEAKKEGLSVLESLEKLKAKVFDDWDYYKNRTANGELEKNINEVERYIKALKNGSLKASYEKSPRALYDVILHEGKTPDQYDYVNWDKPLTESQIEKIKKVIPNVETHNRFTNFENIERVEVLKPNVSFDTKITTDVKTLFENTISKIKSFLDERKIYAGKEKLINAFDDLTEKFDSIHTVKDMVEVGTKLQRFLYDFNEESPFYFKFDMSDYKKAVQPYTEIIDMADAHDKISVNDLHNMDGDKIVNSGELLKVKVETKPLKGEDLYRNLERKFGSDKAASDLLLKAGIDGIKYPAGTLSGGKFNSVGHNYVVFDENAVSIKKKTLYQEARAAIQIGVDGRDIIHAISDPNVSSPVHELAHKWEKELRPDEVAEVLDWTGQDTWTTKTSESFARGFEKYLSEGVAPSEKLKGLFERFREWLLNIYKGILGSDIDIELNDGMRKVYAEMLGEDFEAQIKDEVRNPVQEEVPVREEAKPAEEVAPVSEPAPVVKTGLDRTKDPVLTTRHILETGIRPSPKLFKILKAAEAAEANGAFNSVEGGKQWVKDNYPDLVPKDVPKPTAAEVILSEPPQPEEIMQEPVSQEDEPNAPAEDPSNKAPKPEPVILPRFTTASLKPKIEKTTNVQTTIPENNQRAGNIIGETKEKPKEKAKISKSLSEEVNALVDDIRSDDTIEIRNAGARAAKLLESNEEGIRDHFPASYKTLQEWAFKYENLKPKKEAVKTPEPKVKEKSAFNVGDLVYMDDESEPRAIEGLTKNVHGEPRAMIDGQAYSFDRLINAEIKDDTEEAPTLEDIIRQDATAAKMQDVVDETTRANGDELVEQEANHDDKLITYVGLETILGRLKNKFGVDYQIVEPNHFEDGLKNSKGEYIWRGRFKDGKVYINGKNFTKDTAFHEYLHPFVEGLKQDNNELYTKLHDLLAADPIGQENLGAAKKLYPNDSPQDQADEALVNYLAHSMADMHTSTGQRIKNKYWEATKNLIKKFKEWLVDLLYRIPTIEEQESKESTGKFTDTKNKKIKGEGQYYGNNFVENTKRNSDPSRAEVGISLRDLSPFPSVEGEPTSKVNPEFIEKMTLNDFAQFVGMSDHKFNLGAKIDIINKLDRWQKDPETGKYESAMLNRLQQLLPTFTKTANERQHSSELGYHATVLGKILSKADADEAYSMTKYIAQGVSGLKFANEEMSRIKKTIKAGNLTSRDIVTGLQSRLAVVKTLFEMYKDVDNNWERVIGRKLSAKDKIEQAQYRDDTAILTKARQNMDNIKNTMADLVSEWLFPYVEQAQAGFKDNAKYADRVLTKDQFRTKLFNADSDPDTLLAWLGSMGSSKDPVNATLKTALLDVFKKNHEESQRIHEESSEEYHKFLSRTGLGNDKKTTAAYYEANYLRKAAHWEKTGEDEKGKPVYGYVDRKAFHEEFFHDQHWQERQKYIHELGEMPDPTDKVKYEEWTAKLQKWQDENTQKRKTGKMLDVIDNDRGDFKNPNPNFGKVIGQREEEVVVPSDKYLNPAFAKLKNDPYYMKLYTEYKKANDSYGEHGLKHGVIPQIPKGRPKFADLKWRNGLGNFKEIGKALVGKFEGKDDTTVITGEDGKEYIYSTDDVNLDGSVYNKIKHPYTRLLDEDNVDTILLESVIKYAQESQFYKDLKEAEPNITALKQLVLGTGSNNKSSNLLIGERTASKTTTVGNKTIWTKMMKQITKSETNKLNSQMNGFLDDVLYGEAEMKANLAIGKFNFSLNRLGSNLGFLTAMNNMAFNIGGGIANSTIGNIQSISEAVGGKYYNKRDWLDSHTEYWREVMNGNIISDVTGVKKSAITQLFHMYDAFQGEFRDKWGKNIVGSATQRFANWDTIFFINHAAEHEIQGKFTLAMMRGQKVDLIDAQGNKTGQQISLRDAYVPDAKGYLKLRSDVSWSEDQKASFTRRLHAKNYELNGNYSTFDKAQIQRRWWGKMAIIYRKYLYNGFRARFGQERVDYELGDVIEGSYRNFFGKLASDIKQYKFDAARRLFTREGWDADQRYYMNKTVYELSLLAGTSLLAMGIQSSAQKKDASWAEKEAFLRLLNLHSDIATYSTSGVSDMTRILQNPSVVMGTLGKYGNFFGQLFTDPTETYKQANGIFSRGDSKLVAAGLKALPIARQGVNILQPDEQAKFFQVFSTAR